MAAKHQTLALPCPSRRRPGRARSQQTGTVSPRRCHRRSEDLMPDFMGCSVEAPGKLNSEWQLYSGAV